MEHQNADHFAIMLKAIDYIDGATDGPVSLQDIANHLNMSPLHFKLLFSQWVGVSPKRYEPYLTLDHAKNLLRDRFATLENAGEIRLPESSCINGISVKWEATDQSNFTRTSNGLSINFGWFNSAFGLVLSMGTHHGLCGLAFCAEIGPDIAMSDLASRWPKATFIANPSLIAGWTHAALGLSGETALHMIGAPFQLQVWQALLQIPSGSVTTYSQIAQSIGRPKAVRAVATAIGRNPVSFVIPCHRALRKSGALGGYHWGLNMKRALLAWESSRFDGTY